MSEPYYSPSDEGKKRPNCDALIERFQEELSERIEDKLSRHRTALDGMCERTVAINGLLGSLGPRSQAIRKVHDFIAVGAAARFQEGLGQT